LRRRGSLSEFICEEEFYFSLVLRRRGSLVWFSHEEERRVLDVRYVPMGV